jgi:chromosomal replication initiation ATPase DnaA
MEADRRVLFEVLLRRRFGREDFMAWFRAMRVHEATDRLVLIMPTRFHMRWVDAHYRDDILAAAKATWPDVRRVIYIREKPARDEKGYWTFVPDLQDTFPHIQAD